MDLARRTPAPARGRAGGLAARLEPRILASPAARCCSSARNRR